MQGNPNRTEIEEAFEDKAWLEMNAILDREMPVRKRKRRFLWWFSGIGLLALIGLTYWFLQPTSSAVAEKKDEIASTTEKENIIIEQTNSTSTTKERISADPILENNNLIVKTSEINKPQKQKKNNTPKIVSHTSTTWTNVTNNKSGIASEFDTTPEKELRNTRLSNLDNPISFPYNESSTSIPFSTVSPLESTPLVLAIPARKVSFLIPATITKPTFDKHWNWGMMGAIGTFKFTRFNEYRVGAFASYHFADKWNIQFGGQYQFLRLNVVGDQLQSTLGDLDNIPTAFPSSPAAGMAAEEDNASNDTNDAEETIRTTQPSSIIDQLKGSGYIQYLSLPIALEYHLQPQWRLSFGTNFLYGLSDSYLSVGTSTARLRRWDISSNLGISYYFNDDIGIRASYDLGWFEKRKLLNDPLNNLPSEDRAFSPLEGRFQLTGVWEF